MTLKSLNEIPVTKDMVLREAERGLFQRVVDRRIRNRWQLRHTLMALGALGTALRATDTVKVLDILLG
jgi:hypothetical protein